MEDPDCNKTESQEEKTFDARPEVDHMVKKNWTYLSNEVCRF